MSEDSLPIRSNPVHHSLLSTAGRPNARSPAAPVHPRLNSQMESLLMPESILFATSIESDSHENLRPKQQYVWTLDGDSNDQ